MESTLFYDDNTDLIKNRVFSYEKSQDQDGFNNLIMRFDLVGSGGVYSTIEDLYLWDQNFYNNTLGKGGQEIIRKMHQEGLLNNGESSGYAFALNNGTYRGLKTVSHAGALAGYRAQLMRFPDQNFSVIILANRGDFNPTALSFRVAKVFLKDQFVSEPEEESDKKAEAESLEASERFELKQMTGRYEIAPGIIAEISIQDDSLHVLQLWNQSEYHLSRSGKNIFVIPGAGNIQFIFSELKDGYAKMLTVFQNGNTTPAKRMPDTDLSGLDLPEYQGKYYSREIDATYQLFSDGDRLRMKIPSNPVRDLDPVTLDEFTSERMQLRFYRSDDEIKGFELNDTTLQIFTKYISDGSFARPPGGFVEKTAYFAGYRIIESCVEQGMPIEEICSLDSKTLIRESNYFLMN